MPLHRHQIPSPPLPTPVITWYATFCLWLHLLSTIHWRFINSMESINSFLLLNRIPLYGHIITSYSAIGLFPVWALINKHAITFVDWFLHEYKCSFLLAEHLGVKLLGHIVSMFISIRNCLTIFQIFLQFCMSILGALPPHLHLVLSSSLFKSLLRGLKSILCF